MIPCLNPVTTGGAPSFEAFLDAAVACGYGGVEYSAEPIAEWIREKSRQAACDILSEKGIRLGAFELPVDFRSTEENFQMGLPVLKEYAAAAQTVGCARCVTWLPPAIDEEPVGFSCRTTRRLRECAKILGGHDISLGLEWVGTPTLRCSPDGKRVRKHDFVFTIPQTLELIEAIGEPNIGLLVDSFHWFTARHTMDDLEKLPREKFVHVHINDAPKKPVEQQIDNERLLPGEGIIDLKSFISVLKKKGYHGFIAVETFSGPVSKLGLMGAAKAAKQALDRVLKQVESTAGEPPSDASRSRAKSTRA